MFVFEACASSGPHVNGVLSDIQEGRLASNKKGACGTTPIAPRKRASGTERMSRPSTVMRPPWTSASRSSAATTLLFPAPAYTLAYFLQANLSPGNFDTFGQTLMLQVRGSHTVPYLMNLPYLGV